MDPLASRDEEVSESQGYTDVTFPDECCGVQEIDGSRLVVTARSVRQPQSWPAPAGTRSAPHCDSAIRDTRRALALKDTDFA